ncbi:unnamed protein product [Allacma fusca]|uniref:glutathione transferase n=1 Tax=Allacma fusca TaxID=39272 RepID=A0A8J2JEU9_9HEXA|nr:unnamed protein product [Allacma fusca]
MSKPILGYWNFRGFAQDIRCLLHYLKIDFEDKRYPPGPNFGDDLWLAEKFEMGLDFPNVPYYIEGDVKLSESRAILKYLARAKDPKLIPGTALGQAKAEILEGVLVELHIKLVQSVYSENAPSIPLEVSLDPKFLQIAKFIGTNPFALGDQLQWIDFFLYEVLLQYSKYSQGIFATKPEILRYLKNFEAIPELQEYLNSPAVLEDICLSRKGRVIF